ncbi:MAG: hypothetical protein ACREOZ_02720 [Gloeomargaritales cyanobacterium]
MMIFLRIPSLASIAGLYVENLPTAMRPLGNEEKPETTLFFGLFHDSPATPFMHQLVHDRTNGTRFLRAPTRKQCVVTFFVTRKLTTRAAPV